jgi:hypothetical protein
MGTEFHRWLRDQADTIGLSTESDYATFIQRDLAFYSRQYLLVCEAESNITSGLEHLAYVHDTGFSLYPMLLLAPLKTSDSDTAARLKVRLVAQYLDVLLARRIWNSKSIGYSNMQYAMFNVMRDIRGLPPVDLALRLHAHLQKQEENFEGEVKLRLQQQNRGQIHYLLARLTDWVQVQSGGSPICNDLMNGTPKLRHEIEHIWANKPERHADELPSSEEFGEYRNRIGGLLLLPKKFNASFGSLEYAKKLPHYLSQNLLARSLHEQCYTHNPGFLSFMANTMLPFHAHPQFKKGDIEDRSELYRQVARRLWSQDSLLEGFD